MSKSREDCPDCEGDGADIVECRWMHLSGDRPCDECPDCATCGGTGEVDVAPAKGPPGSRPIKVGRATYYIRPEVEETFRRLNEARAQVADDEALEARKAHRLLLIALLDGLGVAATMTAFVLSWSSLEPLLPVLTGGIALGDLIATAWWWRKTRRLGWPAA